MSETRIEASRTIPASRAEVFALVSDPAGHAKIDGSGMLMSTETQSRMTAVGDSFTMNMDREALGDFPMGKYQVLCMITAFEQDSLIEWDVRVPELHTEAIGHVYGYELADAPEGMTTVTSYCDWSGISDAIKERGVFPIVPQTSLRQTLGILERVLLG